LRPGRHGRQRHRLGRRRPGGHALQVTRRPVDCLTSFSTWSGSAASGPMRVSSVDRGQNIYPSPSDWTTGLEEGEMERQDAKEKAKDARRGLCADPQTPIPLFWRSWRPAWRLGDPLLTPIRSAPAARTSYAAVPSHPRGVSTTTMSIYFADAPL